MRPRKLRGYRCEKSDETEREHSTRSSTRRARSDRMADIAKNGRDLQWGKEEIDNPQRRGRNT